MTIRWCQDVRQMDRLPFLRTDADTAWHQNASCRGQSADPELRGLWFPNDSRFIDPRARAICKLCPVREECLAFAMKTEGSLSANQREGIWGGLSPAERVRLFRLGKKKGQPQVHAPEWRSCAADCGRTFDAWRTAEGKPRKEPRIFCSHECQMVHARRRQTPNPRPRVTVCKLEGCNQMFNPFETFAGKLGTRRPRVYCSSEHQRLGVKLTRAANMNKTEAL